MYISRKSFIEIILPLTLAAFVCVSTSFIANVGDADLRWVFDILLFLYLFINKKLLMHINIRLKCLLFIYLVWCVSTTLWSEVPFLSFAKSSLFAFNILVMTSAGALWITRFGYCRCFDWLFLILCIDFASGILGSSLGAGFDQINNLKLYGGLSGNPNSFGFMLAIISPLIFLKIYLNQANRQRFLMWLFILILDIYFLISSYSRGSIAIFLIISCFFCISLPLSKKILIAISSFFFIGVALMLLPINFFENFVANHIYKSSTIMHSRDTVWDKSYQQAIKGGVIGGGYAVTIGDKHFSDKNLTGMGYGREKGNSQFAIMEETGIIGLILYGLILISFFKDAIPYYRRAKGHKKVIMGLGLGFIVGLLAESIVEGWWDSAAAPEVICFWTLIGVIYGMIYLQKRNMQSVR